MKRDSRTPESGAARPEPGLPLRRLMLLALLVVGLPAAFAIGIDPDRGLDALRQHYPQLLRFAVGEPLLAPLVFMMVYSLAVATSLPGAAVLTMIGGFLFGWVHGTAYVLLAATVAASAVFMFARGALFETVRTRASPSIRRFAAGFRRNSLSYVFVLYLVPIFPYGMIIALPAACGVRLPAFVFSAFFGIVPGTVLLTFLGAQIGGALLGSPSFDMASLLTPKILLAAAGLAALSLLPVVYRAGPWQYLKAIRSRES
jgi:uncharacterized membrane protein YdjX (TVP38/TMEM64 family)